MSQFEILTESLRAPTNKRRTGSILRMSGAPTGRLDFGPREI